MARNNSINNILFGATNGSNATAGYVGEFISSQIVQASAISISNNSQTNLTSISLPAGDWDVWGNVSFIPTTGTVATGYTVGINTTTGALPDGSFQVQFDITFPVSVGQGFDAPSQRINVNSTTIVYIVALTSFSSGTGVKICGGIYARRTR